VRMIQTGYEHVLQLLTHLQQNLPVLSLRELSLQAVLRNPEATERILVLRDNLNLHFNQYVCCECNAPFSEFLEDATRLRLQPENSLPRVPSVEMMVGTAAHMQYGRKWRYGSRQELPFRFVTGNYGDTECDAFSSRAIGEYILDNFPVARDLDINAEIYKLEAKGILKIVEKEVFRADTRILTECEVPRFYGRMREDDKHHFAEIVHRFMKDPKLRVLRFPPTLQSKAARHICESHPDISHQIVDQVLVLSKDEVPSARKKRRVETEDKTTQSRNDEDLLFVLDNDEKHGYSWGTRSNRWLSFESASHAMCQCLINQCCSIRCALERAKRKGESGLFQGKDPVYCLTEATFEVELTDEKWATSFVPGMRWDSTAYEI